MKLFYVALAALAMTVVTAHTSGFNKVALAQEQSRAKVSKVGSIGASDKLYILNNNQVYPGNSTLFEFDVATKKLTTISTAINGAYGGVSGSSVCGEHFYFFGAMAPIRWSLVQVNLNTGEAAYLSKQSPFLFHRIECDPNAKGEGLIAVISTISDPIFSTIKYNPATENYTTIGTFPKQTWLGEDTIFSFTDDMKQLWGSFPIVNGEYRVTGSQLLTMDLESGSVSPPVRYNGGNSKHAPYQIFPSQGSAFVGFFTDLDATPQVVSFCSLNHGSFGIDINDCDQVPELNNQGIPDPTCGSMYYFASFPHATGSEQGLYAFDLSTKQTTKLAELSQIIDKNYVGAIAGVGCH